MDGNIPQHYEMKQENSKGQDVIKEFQEQRKIIIQRIDDYLRDGGRYEQIKNDIKFDVVGNIGIIIYKGKPHSWYKYSKENGIEYYTNISGLEKDEDLGFAQTESGYELNGGKIFKDGKEVIQFLDNGFINTEFVKGVENINFYSELQNTFGLMKAIINGKEVNFSENTLKFSIIRGVSRIKEIMFFKQHGYISDKEFPQVISESNSRIT